MRRAAAVVRVLARVLRDRVGSRDQGRAVQPVSDDRRAARGCGQWTIVGDRDVHGERRQHHPRPADGVSGRAAGTVVGVFKSTNGGSNWSEISDGLNEKLSLNIQTLAIDPVTPTIIYAGTDSGVFSIQQAVTGSR